MSYAKYTGNRIKALMTLFRYAGIAGSLRFVLTKGLVRFRSPVLNSEVLLRGGSSDFATFRQVILQEHYAYARKLPSVGAVLDLGANIGLSALYFSTVFPDARIIAVEPADDNFDLLKLNSQKSDRISLLKAGVAAKDCFLSLRDAAVNSDAYEFSPVEGHSALEGLAIASILDRFKMQNCDLLKMDIEGMECEIFKNAKDWIHRFNSIIVEPHDHLVPGATDMIFETAKRFGFICEKSGEGIAMVRPGII